MHAFTARFSALGEPLNQRGAQDGTQPAKLLDELPTARRELLCLGARHILALAQVLRHCKQKMFYEYIPRGDQAAALPPTSCCQKLTGGKNDKPLDILHMLRYM